MSKDEKKRMIEAMAEKFTGLEENDKSFTVGYMMGKRQQLPQHSRQIRPVSDGRTSENTGVSLLS